MCYLLGVLRCQPEPQLEKEAAWASGRLGSISGSATDFLGHVEQVVPCLSFPIGTVGPGLEERYPDATVMGTQEN